MKDIHKISTSLRKFSTWAYIIVLLIIVIVAIMENTNTEEVDVETPIPISTDDVEPVEEEVVISDTEISLYEQCKQYEGNENYFCLAGINPSDFQYVDYIITVESNYDPYAYNPGDGDNLGAAVGLCQLKEGNINDLGSYYLNPINQLKECDNYVTNFKVGPYSDGPKYGSWYEAYVFHINNGYF